MLFLDFKKHVKTYV